MIFGTGINWEYFEDKKVIINTISMRQYVGIIKEVFAGHLILISGKIQIVLIISAIESIQEVQNE